MRPLKDPLQSLQLAAVEGGPVPALLPLLLLLRVHLLIWGGGGGGTERGGGRRERRRRWRRSKVRRSEGLKVSDFPLTAPNIPARQGDCRLKSVKRVDQGLNWTRSELN